MYAIRSYYGFVWITDFPLLEWDEDEKRWCAVHHPFTAPMDEDVEYVETDSYNFV